MSKSSLNDMKLYRAIRNLMWYWGARIILGQDYNRSLALSNGVHPAEVYHGFNHTRRERYAYLRSLGLDSISAMAVVRGMHITEVRRRDKERHARRRALYGAHPKFGNEAHNRWLMAR